MPRDLFGDVTRPSISVGNRKWYTVPVSLISHAVVIAAIVIVPILAAPLMPGVLDDSTVYRFVDLVPPKPPAAPTPRDEKPKPIPQPGVSVVAPTGISDEPETIPDKPVEVLGVIDGGVDAGDPPPPPRAIKTPEITQPVRINSSVRRPVKIAGQDPVYNPTALAARIQGVVIIEATLAEDGRVMNARILRSLPMLDQAALDAVKTWQYTPTLLNGVPVPVIMTVTVTFTLSR